MARRDDEGFTEFVLTSGPRLRRTAFLLCGDAQLAADLTQEALIRLYVAWPRIERRGGLPTYARRILVNVAIDMARKRSSSEIPSVVPDTAAVELDDPSSNLSSRQALLLALRELGPRQRACVVLRYFDDLSVAETARLLSISEGTVKSQTSRAIETMRKILEDQLDDELTVSNEGGSSW